MKRMLLLGLALSLTALPALADNTILAGIDVWQTKADNNTYVDLTLPAGFFCTTSAPFSGRVVLAGVPVATSPAGVLGATDTVVERLSSTTFDANGVATVNAIVRAASFKSTAPITVSGCPGSTQWDVRSSAAPTQSPFLITIRRPDPTATGGSFDSSVTISPRLIFTQQVSGLQRTLDQATITFTTSGAEWTHAPGSGGVTYTGGPVQIDTDGDGATDTQVPPTSNFAPGWSRFPRTGCAAPPCPVPIPHQAPSHFHYVLPPPLRCNATAACGDGSSVSCSGSTPTSCSAADTNCGAGERGHVTCDGVTISCPTACAACSCAALRADCLSRCGGAASFRCNATTCESSCFCL
jgi:hypothetical protein